MSIARFVDAHVHLWKLDHLRYAWLSPPFSDDGPNGSVEPIAHDYSLDDYFADAGAFKPEKIVHVDAGADPADALGETRWLQAMADETGYPNAIVAFAGLNDPNVEALLAAHVEHKAVRGIRHIINWHPNPKRTYTPRDLLEDDAFARGYALLAKYNLSFDLQIYPNQMTSAYRLARANEGVPAILNHTGMPVDQDAAGIARWKDGMRLLASLPHVFVKISGLGFIDRQWTAQSMRGLVLETIDTFGADRCAFASDFPTDKLFNRFSHAMDAFDVITNDFTKGERDALFFGNACKIYKI